MANFMGPMAPPQAAPQQPPQMDIKTSPMQRAQFKNFMRGMSAPSMPQVLPNIGMGVPSPDQTMAPMPTNPMMNVDIFSQPVQYMAGGGYAGSGMERGRGGTGMGDVGFSGASEAPSVSGPSIDLGGGGGSKNDALTDILSPAPQQSFAMPGMDILGNVLNMPGVGSNLPSPIQGAMDVVTQGISMPGPMGIGSLNIQPTFSGSLSDPNLGIQGLYSVNFEDGGIVPVQHFRYGGYSGGIAGGERGRGSSAPSGGGNFSQGSRSSEGGGGGGGGRERAMEDQAQKTAQSQAAFDAINDFLDQEQEKNQVAQDLADFQSDVLMDKVNTVVGIPPTTSAPSQQETDLTDMINEAVAAENQQGAYGVSPVLGSLAGYTPPEFLQSVIDYPDQDLAPMLDTPSYTTSIYDKAMTDLQKRANAEISGFPVSIPGTDISFKIPTSFDLITTGIGSYMAGNIEDKIKAGGQPVYDANNKIIGVNHPGFLGGTVYTGQNFPEERQGRDFVPPILPTASDIQSEDVTQTPPNQIGGITGGGVTTPESNQSGQSVVVPSTRVSSPFFMRPQATFDPSQILTAEYFRNLLTPQRPLAMQKGGSVIDAAAERFLGSLRAA